MPGAHQTLKKHLPNYLGRVTPSNGDLHTERCALDGRACVSRAQDQEAGEEATESRKGQLKTKGSGGQARSPGRGWVAGSTGSFRGARPHRLPGRPCSVGWSSGSHRGTREGLEIGQRGGVGGKISSAFQEGLQLRLRTPEPAREELLVWSGEEQGGWG